MEDQLAILIKEEENGLVSKEEENGLDSGAKHLVRAIGKSSRLFLMDEAEPPSHSPPLPPFLEVKCKSSGTMRRFAVGTEAGFAVSLINRKLSFHDPISLHIEAAKDGEEPISFGPNSVLVDYGNGWILQTVIQLDYDYSCAHVTAGSESLPAGKRVPLPALNFMYIGKIVLAFILIFVLGAILTLFLENIPQLMKILEQYV